MQGDYRVDIKQHRTRVENTWGGRSGWTKIYQDAYDYAIPMRRPSGGLNGRPQQPDRLFDMTAPMSAMYFAGNLQRDLFPAGQPAFELETGPLAAMVLSSSDKKAFDRELARTSTLIHPFFLAGDWDTAIHEMCVDLAVGTGALLPVKGKSANEPIRFACLPFDELAISADGFGAVDLVDWRTQMRADQIVEAWPKGRFPADFKEKAVTKPSEPYTVHQTWWKDRQGAGWHFGVLLETSTELLWHERYRTQPIAIPRYYRVPGEAYGRGVVLTALPSIKTVNKAQELALKSAAISMLGIWGYRAGGTFNPNTVRLGPGEFWAMQSTGGMLGPDVSRLDTASGNLNVAQLLIGDLQNQIKAAMFDTRLPDYEGTPRSASEMAARLQQRANIHIGAFGRLVNEIMPVVVPRVAEILYEFNMLPMVREVDDLLVSVKVKSPMQAALNADRIAAIANYHDFILAFAGPEAKELYIKQDAVLDRVAEGFQIDKDLVPDDQERAAIVVQIEERRKQQMAMMMAAEAAKQAPGAIKDVAVAEMRRAA
ncbi:bacteriophage head to tail connecting protein [Sinorhizobium sp. KGO-5]|uniref:portal protein n=1 Tax=Sinorhizobium sp. KGO-5 TaxID=1470810 RepID=UPI002948E590|nr:bacteriophage head to tail connecting protein [Sinorhizobium sp. KGO-5]